MKKGFLTAYSIAAFVVLAIAVAWFCVSVLLEARRGNEEAERTFSWLCREMAQNSYSLGFMSNAYIEKTTNLCQEVDILIAITISSPTETFYAWPANSPDIVQTEGRSLEIERSSLFLKIMDAGVDMGANASPAIRVTATLRTLSSSVIFAASRNSFILVFIVLLSSIIVLLVAPAKIQEKVEEKSSANKYWEDADFKEADYKEHEEMAASFFESESEDEGENEIPESKPALDSAQESVLAPEHYLEERLNEELARAAAAETDVSILILRVFGMNCSGDDFRSIAKIVADFFKRGDLIFKFGFEALACVIPEASLDETMQKAEHLYFLLSNYLTENNLDNRMCIGISTRMTRTVPASRMIHEADTAAKKAEEEERLPIVAFRANPEKYKDYMAKSQS